jgi:hypothetical protein
MSITTAPVANTAPKPFRWPDGSVPAWESLESRLPKPDGAVPTIDELRHRLPPFFSVHLDREKRQFYATGPDGERL